MYTKADGTTGLWLKIAVPPDVESEIIVTSKPFLAEIKMQEMIKRSPRAPVWVRFRWSD